MPRSLVTGCGYAKGRRLHDTAPPLRATLPCGRAEPAPPRECAPHKEASRGRSPRPRREDLSEGCAPRVRGVRPYASPGMACSSKGERTPSGLMETCPVKPSPSLWACGARPSRGASPTRMALRGKPGHNAGGGFLGGARSARPDAEAVIKPRHNRIIGAKRTPGGLEGTRLGQAQAIPAGVQSPPLLVGLRTRPLLGTNKKTF